MDQSSNLRTRLAAFGLALLLVACDSQATPSPSAPIGSQAAHGSESPGSTPGGNDGPGPLVTAGPGDVDVEPLPAPSLTDPGSIGQELYNPAGVSVAVVSLLDAMGVEIRADDGSVVRPGADRGAGLISLTETQVRGLIDMTREDLKGEATDAGVGPFTVAQLFGGIQAMFPDGYTVDAFADAFDSAYREDPASLASAVMLGMPIMPETRLLRVHAWLLLVDGFPDAENLGFGAATAAAVRFTAPRAGSGGARSASGGLGAAALNLPASTSPVRGWSPAEWRGVLRMLPNLAHAIPFKSSGMTSVHEGHGRPGDRFDLDAVFGRGPDLLNLQTGVALLKSFAITDGLPMVWNSTRPGVLADHGQVRSPLGTTVLTDGNGEIHSGYQAKQEDSNGRGELIREVGNLYAEVQQLALVRAGYRIPAALDAILQCACIITGVRRTPHPDFDIRWHEEDVLEITIENYYDYTVPIPLPHELFSLSRKGKDVVRGTLALNKDGTYSGILHATNSGTANGKAMLGLAGVAECSTPDVSTGEQDLYVVGQKVGVVSLLLRFFPASTPGGTFTNCQAVIEYPGNDILGMAAGRYLPLNDTRWQNPDVGIEIPIPSRAGDMIDQYEDRYLYDRENDLCSVFYITVIWPDPDAATVPTGRPPLPVHLCE